MGREGDTVKERPILFSAPMVRAILAGTKTQTRRLYKPRHSEPHEGVTDGEPWWCDEYGDYHPLPCKYGAPGDRLWVKETILAAPGLDGDHAIFSADGALTKLDSWPWKRSILSSIHCPRGLSRITLGITAVRFQRLQDISEEDARAEGVVGDGIIRASSVYFELWDAINGEGSWMLNPWVWAITFTRVARGAAKVTP